MSFLARRAIIRAPLRARRFATENIVEKKFTAATSPFLAELDAIEHHAVQTTDLWRKISYFVAAPAIAVCVAWVYQVETEHAHHVEHLKHEGTFFPPDYPYLNRRSKPYPWGPNSLFFNPETQKDLSDAA